MRYFICWNCGELIDSDRLDENLRCGGDPYCYCAYCVHVWNPTREKFEPEHDRIYMEYTEIPRVVYEGLLKCDNTCLRLKMLQTVNLKTYGVKPNDELEELRRRLTELEEKYGNGHEDIPCKHDGKGWDY